MTDQLGFDIVSDAIRKSLANPEGDDLQRMLSYHIVSALFPAERRDSFVKLVKLLRKKMLERDDDRLFTKDIGMTLGRDEVIVSIFIESGPHDDAVTRLRDDLFSHLLRLSKKLEELADVRCKASNIGLVFSFDEINAAKLVVRLSVCQVPFWLLDGESLPFERVFRIPLIPSELVNPKINMKIEDAGGHRLNWAHNCKYPDRSKQVFLSYNHHDLETVKFLYRDLAAAGYNCWFDKVRISEQEPGFERIIYHEIGESAVVLICLSEAVMQNHGYVYREFDKIAELADLQAGGPIVIPVSVGSKSHPLPAQFYDLQPVSYSTEGTVLMVADAIDYAMMLGIWKSRDFPKDAAEGVKLAETIKSGRILSFISRMFLPIGNGADRWVSQIFVIESKIATDFLGKKSASYRKSYIGEPSRKQYSRDIRKKYPFAITSELDREAAVGMALIALVMGSPPTEKGGALGVIGKVIPKNALKDEILQISKAILLALRTSRPQSHTRTWRAAETSNRDFEFYLTVHTTIQEGSSPVLDSDTTSRPSGTYHTQAGTISIGILSIAISALLPDDYRKPEDLKLQARARFQRNEDMSPALQSHVDEISSAKGLDVLSY